MPARAAQIETPDAALAGDAGLQGARAFARMLERALVTGDAQEQAVAGKMLLAVRRGSDPLNSAGLGGAGYTPLRRLRLHWRNARIRRIARDHHTNKTDAAVAEALAGDWRRYESTNWRRDEAAQRRPTDQPAASFFDLLHDGHDVLAERTIRQILASPNPNLGIPDPMASANEGVEDRPRKEDQHDF